MCCGAYAAIGEKISGGLIATKYKHSKNPPKGVKVIEAGHPSPDENSVRAAEAAMELCAQLEGMDTVLLLISGGGSALFESPVIPIEQLKELTDALMKAGCDIGELNCVRKHLSRVKGGRFALHCAPARLECLILSDVIGDPLDVIASGIACPDPTTVEQAQGILDKYGIAKAYPLEETPKSIASVESRLVGNLKILCEAAKAKAEELGYTAEILSDCVEGEASEVAALLCERALQLKREGVKGRLLIMGGETTVTVRGQGKGGRNQELALTAAVLLEGREGIAVFAVGSDGTDGPTEAAGGIVDGSTCGRLSGRRAEAYLADNDSYHGLKQASALIVTGPTGTNVNDLYCALIYK